MDFRQVRYFLAVVDQGGVHRAAEALFVAQPSVSQAIRNLERDLGVALFHRTGRRMVLTPAGEAFTTSAREVMRAVELARADVDAVDGLRAGRLVISSTSSQAASPLAPLVSAFLTRHPDVQVLVRAAAHRDLVVAALRQGDSELGLIARPTSEAAPPDLVVQPVELQGFFCVARDEDALPPGDGLLRPRELSGARLIVGLPGTGMRRAADVVLAEAPDSVVVVEVEHREALLPLVLSGAGVAVVAEALREAALVSGLVVRGLDVPETLSVELMHRAGRLSPAARAFLAVAVEFAHARR